MDHIYLDMKPFLFAYIFLGGLNLVFQASWQLFVLSVKVYLQKRGYISKPTFDDASEVAAKLALETSISVHCKHQNDDKIATFSIENFAIIPAACDVLDTSKTMTFKVDLKTKRIVSSFLDDRELNDEETVNLLFFHLLFKLHPKVHAFSNWAVNMEECQFKMNPFIAQNSLVTTMYNYYGYTAFASNIPNFVYLGVMSPTVGPSTIQDVFDFSMESTVPEHGSIRELAPYSRLVNFLVKLRPHFMKEFNKTKHMYFPGCHGEALFAQTVLHSLDHQNAEWIVDDPLSFAVNHPDFGIMAEFNRVVRAGFLEDLDGLLFTKSFKDSKHPFYRSIYEKARTIDQTLADHMDTCIIK